MIGIPDRIILLPKGKIKLLKQKDLEENQDQFKKRIGPFKKLNFQVYVLDYKENRKSSLLLDMGLDKTVIGVMAIKDLFLDAFAITKVLITVPLRVARYTWKEEI